MFGRNTSKGKTYLPVLDGNDEQRMGVFLRDFIRSVPRLQVMILWLIALVLVGCVGTVGYYQGALRAAFSFIGLLLAAMLASPAGSLLKPLILILGLKNPVEIAFVAPVAAFAIVLVLF